MVNTITDTSSKLYTAIESKLKDAYDINVGLINADDKIFVLLPNKLMRYSCSKVFDLITEVAEEFGLRKADMSKHIVYKLETDYDFTDRSIMWYN